MADTLPNILVPEKQWTDIYSESGIVVGTKIQIQNIGSTDLYLYSGASAPGSVPGGGYIILRPFMTASNDTGDAGAWISSLDAGKINVKEFV